MRHQLVNIFTNIAGFRISSTTTEEFPANLMKINDCGQEIPDNFRCAKAARDFTLG